MRQWQSVLVGVGVVLTMVGGRLLLADRFRPFDLNVDFSHEPAVTSLDPAMWEVAPVPRWPGVFELFDRGRPASVSFDLPAQAAYELRLKVTFRAPEAGVTYALNGIPLGTWTASQVGAAEKRRLGVTPDRVRAGQNTLTFINQGPRRSVLYEQVRVRNFRSAPWKPHLYIVPSTPGGPFRIPVALWLAAVPLAFGVWWGSAAVWAWLGGWPRPVVLTRVAWVWMMVGIGTVAMALVPRAGGYQIAASAVGCGAFIGGLWVVGQLPLALAAALRRLLQALLATGRFAHATAPTVQASAWALLCLTGQVLWCLWLLVIRGVWGTGRWSCLTAWQVGTLAWRWFAANQHPVGYLKMAVGLFLMSVPIQLLRWKSLAIALGHLSGIAVVIACLLEAIRALREEGSSPS